ncbi:MAG: hypothetical protein NVS9B1_26860 [Candidatus Dormibacteraceae bacterium]
MNTAAPWRDETTPACRRCGTVLTATNPTGRPALYCGPACRQADYRDRQARPSRTETGVYECPDCGQRLAGERRCPDCNLFARRLGDGGTCSSCGEILTTSELLTTN